MRPAALFALLLPSAGAFVPLQYSARRYSTPLHGQEHGYELRSGRSPFDVHVYFSSADERAHALGMRDKMQNAFPWMRYYEPKDRPIGPHPVPMWEADFAAFEHRYRWSDVVAFVEAERGPCSVLIHPYSTDGDYADHTTNAYWAGPPLQLRLRKRQ